MMNTSALIAVVILATALLLIFGSLYRGAVRSGEVDSGGLRILRWALLGQITLYILLAMTAFL